MRVGLIGYGYWGPNLARTLNQTEKCEFVACCDANPRSLGKAVRSYPSLKGFSSANDIQEPDFDIKGIFGLLAKDDYDRAVELAGGFQGEATRAAAVIAIARSVLNEKGVSVPTTQPAARN